MESLKSLFHLLKTQFAQQLPVTKINGTLPGTDYSKSRPDEPILVYVNSINKANIFVEGDAYDSGSGIKNVEIHLKAGPYQPVNHKSLGWSKWFL